MAFGLLFLICSCVTIPRLPQSCTSYCGSLLDRTGNEAMNCDNLAIAEATTILSLDLTFCQKDPKFCSKNTCEQLFGWQIKAGIEINTMVPQNMNGTVVKLPAHGVSNCATKEMWIG